MLSWEMETVFLTIVTFLVASVGDFNIIMPSVSIASKSN